MLFQRSQRSPYLDIYGLRDDSHRGFRFRSLCTPHVYGRNVSHSTSIFYVSDNGYRGSNDKIPFMVATMWGGSVEFKTPMLWAIGFCFSSL